MKAAGAALASIVVDAGVRKADRAYDAAMPRPPEIVVVQDDIIRPSLWSRVRDWFR